MLARFRARALPLALLLAVTGLEGCTPLGYMAGTWVDRSNPDRVSSPPWAALPELRRGENVECVLRDSSRVVGRFSAAGPWKDGDRFRLRDGTVLTPKVRRSAASGEYDGEFFGLRVMTDSVLCVVDTSDVARVVHDRVGVKNRIIATTTGLLLDTIAIIALANAVENIGGGYRF